MDKILQTVLTAGMAAIAGNGSKPEHPDSKYDCKNLLPRLRERKEQEIVGELVAGLSRESVIIQSKWLGLPVASSNLIHSADAPFKALEGMLKCLKLNYVDILLGHEYFHRQLIPTVAKGLAKRVDLGLTRTVGVANYAPDDFMVARKELVKYDIPLMINQCEYNVLRRRPEIDGDTQAYRGMKVIVFRSYLYLARGAIGGGI
ncbi:NADP-dependent oxidoreductase domain-containing protein [Xylariaceae sp. AK1471]|nr:NADP-dependent oxidoreductase domain-containing protein [Xylariaceae sp. AK1471]